MTRQTIISSPLCVSVVPSLPRDLLDGVPVLAQVADIAQLSQPSPDARPFIRDLLEFVEVPPTGTDAARQAVGFPMKDFEDALQAASALAFGASYIVTRNARHYRRSPVPVISPAEFVAEVRRAH